MKVEESIERWIQPAVRAMSAYHVPESQGLIKLDAMENPYSWPEEIKQAWLASLADAEINRYPDAESKQLKQQIARTFAIPESSGILLGNGSDEIIQLLAMAMAQSGRVIMAPEPSFVMYKMVAQITGMQFVGVPLQADDFSLDMPAMLAAIEEHQPGIIFLAWPNNPTGNLFDENELIRLIEKAPGIVVLDEAYHAFAQKSCLPLLEQYDNLLVMRTLSKLGLAGLRLGFIAGHPAWINEFDKLRMPYNIGVLTQRSVAFILEHIEVLNKQAGKIRGQRDSLHQQLSQLPGIQLWPSAANFLLLRVEQADADEVHSKLKDQGILVKNLNTVHDALRNCLRIAVGTEEENQKLLKALQVCLSA